MASRQTFLFFGALLGAVFLYLALRNTDWPSLLAALRQADWVYVALGLLAVLSYFSVKAFRWRYLIEPFARADTSQLLSPVLAGLAGNYAFPHVGEIARALLAGRRLDAPVSALLASVAIERIFDFAVILAIVLAVLVPLGRMSEDIAAACYFVASLSAIMLAIVSLFLLRTNACLHAAGRILAMFPDRFAKRALSLLRASSAGLAAIATPRLFLPVILLSAAQWLLVLTAVACSVKAVGATAALPGVVSALLLNVIGLTLPAAPGHVGTIQLAFVVGLEPFGVDRASALASSIVYNVLMVVPAVALGLPGLRRAGIELRERLFRADPAGR
jgi:uncharacterized protein (TIRG00374 family)